jgi:hypothetical protein
LLVDNAELNKFGGEVKFRVALEGKLRQLSEDATEKVPLVMLVVGGGPGTYNTCLEFVESKEPVVLIEVNKKKKFFYQS